MGIWKSQEGGLKVKMKIQPIFQSVVTGTRLYHQTPSGAFKYRYKP